MGEAASESLCKPDRAGSARESPTALKKAREVSRRQEQKMCESKDIIEAVEVTAESTTGTTGVVATMVLAEFYRSGAYR